MIPKLYHPKRILFFFLLISQIAFADFTLVCPPDVTISCREDYLHDLNMYGRAYTDFNGVISYPQIWKTVIDIDDCGKGTITRSWGVENPENWQWLGCKQVITVSNADGFLYTDITWPQSIVIRSCDPQNDLKNLQSPYDKPTWDRQKCAKPLLSYKDNLFRVDDGCQKIVREWKVLDWCQYDPVLYPGRGIYTYTQVIKLISTSDSVNLICKKDTIVFNSRSCDTVFVQMDSAIFQTGCKIYHKISNTSKYALSAGANASGYYPNGITKFYYIGEYACGTEVKCEVTVDVRNKILPTPYCLTGVTLTLMPVDANNDGVIDDGMVTVWASDLDKGSWHKCPGQKLRFSFSKDVADRSRTYTCKDVGTNEVEIWVTDTLGNQDVCKTIVEIQNNNPNIPNCTGNIKAGKKSIQGKVIFINTIAPPKLQVSLSASGVQSEVVLDKSSHFEYQFKDLDAGQSYDIQSHCQYFVSSVLDYDDLSYLRKLIDGKVKPTSPYVWLAADINQDHVINQQDYELLKQVIYFRRYNVLPSNWIFIPESFSFANPSDPLREIMPTGIEVNKLDHDMTDQNFIAIRVGDLVSKVSKDSNLGIRGNNQSIESSFELLDCRIKNQLNGSSVITWHFKCNQTQPIQLQLLTLDGKQLLNKELQVSEGIEEYNFETSAMGLLFYNVHSANTTISNKLFLSN